jgi:hypothetical protein
MVETINLYKLAMLAGIVEGQQLGVWGLLGSAFTVQRNPTGGARAKPLLGSANTVRLGLVRLG